jgi:hypothetical protein
MGAPASVGGVQAKYKVPNPTSQKDMEGVYRSSSLLNDKVWQAAEKQATELGAEAEKEAQKLAAPDLTDEAMQNARQAQLKRLGMGRGRRSTFLTQGLDGPSMGKTTLGGY